MKSRRSTVQREVVRALRFLGAVALGAVVLGSAGSAQAGRLDVATISGSINPASADYLIQSIRDAEEDGSDALLIELDTPGGLVSSTKDILQAMLNSRVPIIVYVSPSGAWASSAGTFITVAAHVAAMAPGTSIGAAHPVSIGGGGGGAPKPAVPGGEDEESETPPGRDLAMEKAENFLAAYMESIAKQRGRNVEWIVQAIRESVAVDEQKALELNVIDIIAADRRALLEAIEGREVEIEGETIELALVGAEVRALEMTTLQLLFDFLADPNVAVVLFLAGLIGLYVEVNNPGLIVPGAIGAVCLILTAIAFQILPFSWVGLMLILAGVGLLVAEIFVTSFGFLFAAGVACFLLGGTMLFDRPDLSDLTVSFWTVLVPAVLGVSVFGGIVVLAVGRSLFARQSSGVDELIGLVGRATTLLDPDGKVFIRGEYWTAESSELVTEGEAVEVLAVQGLRLRVKPASQS